MFAGNNFGQQRRVTLKVKIQLLYSAISVKVVILCDRSFSQIIYKSISIKYSKHIFFLLNISWSCVVLSATHSISNSRYLKSSCCLLNICIYYVRKPINCILEKFIYYKRNNNIIKRITKRCANSFTYWFYIMDYNYNI